MFLQDAYRKLGLTPGAPDEDVRKAYKKLAMQHHPDKGGDAEKFKEISEAYTQITKDDNPMDSFPELSEIFKMFGLGSFGDIMGGMAGGGIDIGTMMGLGSAVMRPRGPTISTALGITLEELETGGTFEVKYSRRVPTGKMKQQVSETPMGVVAIMAPEEIENIYTANIDVPACHDDRKILSFPGKAKAEGVPAGTLEVRLVVHPHELKRVPGTLDLNIELEISLKEALTGFEREIKLLNKEEPLKLECSSVVNPYDHKRIGKSGLKSEGDLIIGFKIQFPVLLEQSTRKVLRELPDL